jgi:hypothetical protein
VDASALRGGPLARGLAATLAVTASGLLATAFGAPASSTATAAAPGGQTPQVRVLPRCRTAQLSTAFTGLNASMGGGQGMTLILTNHSSRTCYLYGYVRLGLLGGHSDLHSLPTHVTRVKVPHRLVKLHPGGNAQAPLTWRSSTLAGGKLEYPQRVDITPPGASRHLTGMWPKVPVNDGKIELEPLRPAPAGPVPTGSGTVRNPFNGMCVAAAGNGSADGTQVVAWECSGDASQQWTAYSDGTLRINGKCLDITGRSTAVGAAVDLAACDGSAAQRWQIRQVSQNSFGPIVNPWSGNALTDPDGSTVNGTQLLMGPDHGDQTGPWHVSFYHYLGH